MQRYRLIFSTVVLALISATLAACSSQSMTSLHMASLDQMPVQVQTAPVTVQQAYQFAVANPDVMKDIPCYCGCGRNGHTSNYDCYVSNVDPNGNLTFDNHALGCSICVDITQDVMRMTREGKSPQAARNYIDATYAKYGPSNLP